MKYWDYEEACQTYAGDWSEKHVRFMSVRSGEGSDCGAGRTLYRETTKNGVDGPH